MGRASRLHPRKVAAVRWHEKKAVAGTARLHSMKVGAARVPELKGVAGATAQGARLLQNNADARTKLEVLLIVV